MLKLNIEMRAIPTIIGHTIFTEYESINGPMRRGPTEKPESMISGKTELNLARCVLGEWFVM